MFWRVAKDLVLVSREGQVIRIKVKTVKRLGRDTQGVTLMRLKSGDKVASVTMVDQSEESTNSAVASPKAQNAAVRKDEQEKKS